MSAESAFLLFYWLVIGNLVIGVPLLCVISMALPDLIKRDYYREPFYAANELRWLTRFPVSVFSNAALASMFVWPALGRKRGVVPMGDELPTWYRSLLQVYFWATSISLVIALATGVWLLAMD